jgi:PASTA domain
MAGSVLRGRRFERLEGFARIAEDSDMTSYEEMGPEQPQGWSPLAVAMIATLVLLLGLAGALFGIYVANVNAAAAAAAASPTPSATATPTTPVTPTTPPVTATPTPTVTTNPPAPETFPLPTLTGLDFMEARTKVRQLGLDWTLKFGPTGDDPTVVSTSPSAGVSVSPGTTILIVVEGRAPLADVPDIVGDPCADGTAMIIEAGLYPNYLTSARTGKVVLTAVLPGARWNDKMSLACGG